MRLSNLLVGASLLLIPGCGGGGSSSGGGHSVPVQISPSNVSLPVSGSQQFTASINTLQFARFGWTVQEGAAGGVVNGTGFYKAPATAGMYHVVATEAGNAAASATATVSVHVTVEVSPAAPNATLGQKVQFNATVLGSANQNVTWQIDEGAAGGNISSSGLYAPISAGTYHITATSAVDTSQQATATVTVQSGSASGTVQ